MGEDLIFGCAATAKGFGPEGRRDLQSEMTEEVGHEAGYLLICVEQETMILLDPPRR